MSVLFFSNKNFVLRKWNFVFEKLNKTDISLHFLTVVKVAVSLPTKCLVNYTSGSALRLIGSGTDLSALIQKKSIRLT